MYFIAILLVACVGLTSCTTEADPDAPARSTADTDSDLGMALAAEMQQTINTMVDYTTTTCIPAAGTEPGSYSFIALSDESVFGAEAAKRAWLVVVVASAGQVLRNHPDLSADQIILSDSSLMAERKAFAIDAELAKTLQERVSTDKITLEAMYAEILARLEDYVIPTS